MEAKIKVNLRCSECLHKRESLFCDIQGSTLDEVLVHRSCIKYRKGQVLYYEGTPPHGIYCLNSGVVKMTKLSSRGKEQIVRLAKAEIFGIH
ncbi:MAG: cyclic nucleotide-binding domain-containing protein [Cytophagales bacterium]|nr:cyclic nucleotide-binding domain-containing protein [Cytophagales bacterium]